jgi:aryl-alcohol dehydrogenase-like predicted oxidoreductase
MSKPENLPEMEYRFLGRSGLQVSALSLGGWLTYGGHVDREGTYDCMKTAYDCGVNFFDCAEGYADGESEKVMGEAIRKYGWKRNDLVISTKVCHVILTWADRVLTSSRSTGAMPSATQRSTTVACRASTSSRA